MVTSLPLHLRAERVLAQYWEDLGLRVESVSVGRNVGSLQYLLEERTAKLLALETAWVNYVGNPVSKKASEAGYDRDDTVRAILESGTGREEGAIRGDRARVSEDDGLLVESTPAPATDPGHGPGDAVRNSEDIERALLIKAERFVIANKTRPKTRAHILSMEKVDLLDHLAHQFRVADEAVRKRRSGRFKPTHVGFVTFASIESAQIAAQVTHYPQPGSMITDLAPDPRDIHWHNMLLSNASVQARQVLVLGATIALLLFWAIPVGALARLLNYEAIKEYLPWLVKVIDRK